MFNRVSILILMTTLSGCLETNKEHLVAPIKTTSVTFAPAGGPMAAKIIFLASNPSGSFNAGSSSTANRPGVGHPALRVFKADGTLMAEGGYNNPDWPRWLVSTEVTISGANNSAATDSNCARFAAAASDGVALCDFSLDGTADTPCGAPTGYYRVSEKDCAAGTMADGTGGPYDGVTIRTVFSRDPEHLALHENLMAVIEYSSSAINPPPQDPTTCFNDGKLDPTQTGCADMTWQFFLKRTHDGILQPLMTLIPPTVSWVKTSGNRSGTGIETRKITIPLSTDAKLSILQLSRIKSLPSSSPNFSSICSSNSALCLGVVLNSITFYRI